MNNIKCGIYLGAAFISLKVDVRGGVYSRAALNLINMVCRVNNMDVPRGGLYSFTVPRPASSSILMALTAPFLFPLSRNRFAAKWALGGVFFQGGGGNM